MPKLNPTQVGRAAEHFVVAEIHRRGGYAACIGGNMPEIDVRPEKPLYYGMPECWIQDGPTTLAGGGGKRAQHPELTIGIGRLHPRSRSVARPSMHGH